MARPGSRELRAKSHRQYFRKAMGSMFERPWAVRSKGYGQHVITDHRYNGPSSSTWTIVPASWGIAGLQRQSSRGSSLKKIDFAHRLNAVVCPGSRELRAVEIPDSYDAWRSSIHQQNDSQKIGFYFFWSQKAVFRNCR